MWIISSIQGRLKIHECLPMNYSHDLSGCSIPITVMIKDNYNDNKYGKCPINYSSNSYSLRWFHNHFGWNMGRFDYWCKFYLLDGNPLLLDHYCTNQLQNQGKWCQKHSTSINGNIRPWIGFCIFNQKRGPKFCMD